MMSLIFFHFQEVRNQNWIFPKKKSSHSVEYNIWNLKKLA